MKTRLCAGLGALVVALSLHAAPAFAGGTGLQGSNTGNVEVKVLGTVVAPESDLKHGGDNQIHVGDSYIPSLSLSYFLTDHWALEAICCFSKNTISNRRLLGVSHQKIATTWIFPPTVSLQYHQQIGRFRPYAGVGLSYLAFFDEKSYAVPGIDLKNAWGVTVGGGMDVALGKGWQLSFDVKKVLALNSDLYAGKTYVDTVELDPWLISAGVGYRFNFSDLFKR